MGRSREREEAFILVFEKSFNDDVSVDDILSFAVESEFIKIGDYAEMLFKTVYKHLAEIDEIIEKFSDGWKLRRLPKITLAVLRLSVGEILFSEKVPTAVSINEAVELAKKYGNESDAKYINGILGSFSRSKQPKEVDDKKMKEDFTV